MKLFSKDKLPSNEAIRYAEEQTKVYKQQVIKATNDYIQLQSNWNILKEYCEENKYLYSGFQGEDREENLIIMGVLDKMNELEGNDTSEC